MVNWRVDDVVVGDVSSIQVASGFFENAFVVIGLQNLNLNNTTTLLIGRVIGTT
jgi:hypothetical protein